MDYRFIEANPAFEREAGVNLRGKWVTEFAPDLERFWFETYGRVAKDPGADQLRELRRGVQALVRRPGRPGRRPGRPADRDHLQRRDRPARGRRSACAPARHGRAGRTSSACSWRSPPARSSAPGTGTCPRTGFTVDEGFARSFGLDPALGREGIPLARIVATVHPTTRAGLAAANRRGGGAGRRLCPPVPGAPPRRALLLDVEAKRARHHAADGTPLSFPAWCSSTSRSAGSSSRSATARSRSCAA